jgi:cell division protein FtsA
MTNVMQNPKFSTVLGLLLESYENNRNELGTTLDIEQRDIITKLGDSLRNVFREIF